MDLLLDWLYYEPVGHMVEALKVSRGLTSKNPGLRVTVLINSDAPLTLADACPWVERVIPIDLEEVVAKGEKASCYGPLRSDWDFVIHNELPQRDGERGDSHGWMEDAFFAHRAVLDATLRPHRGVGTYHPTLIPEGLEYDPETSIRLEVPAAARAWAKDRCHGRTRVAVLPAGSGDACRYPSTNAWSALLQALSEALPTPVFFLTGRSSGDDGQTWTESVGATERRALVEGAPNMEDCFDIGLHRQLALLEACDFLISPHSGFSFLAPCVGTPWLAISGGDWCEYLFQEVPFWCDLPLDSGFPHYGFLDTGDQTEKIPGMSDEELLARTPGIVGAAQLLLREDFDFAQAEARYEAELAKAQIRVDRMPRAPLRRF